MAVCIASVTCADSCAPKEAPKIVCVAISSVSAFRSAYTSLVLLVRHLAQPRQPQIRARHTEAWKTTHSSPLPALQSSHSSKRAARSTTPPPDAAYELRLTLGLKAAFDSRLCRLQSGLSLTSSPSPVKLLPGKKAVPFLVKVSMSPNTASAKCGQDTRTAFCPPRVKKATSPYSSRMLCKYPRGFCSKSKDCSPSGPLGDWIGPLDAALSDLTSGSVWPPEQGSGLVWCSHRGHQFRPMRDIVNWQLSAQCANSSVVCTSVLRRFDSHSGQQGDAHDAALAGPSLLDEARHLGSCRPCGAPEVVKDAQALRRAAWALSPHGDVA
eukprot:scaffold137_cov398-Prasinococcus_capsulatus_cf.AAC.18